MYIIWAILGIIFLCLEFFKSSILKMTLASTFLFCAVVAHKFPQNYLYQFYALISFSMLFNFLIKTSIKKDEYDRKKISALDDFVGKIAIVKKDIGKTLSIDGLGFIEYDNELWSAKSIDDKLIKAGAKVEIVSKEDKIMNVKVVK